ncbi:right-handed parallel beta-helix repeat-containing protein [Candidatus Omnitrophota bacterium]
MILRSHTASLLVLLLAVSSISCGKKTPGNIPSPETVSEVMDGTRTTANAAWWGFEEEDATEALQAAINSGAKTVIIPNMGKDWIVRPIMLAGNQVLEFQEGTVVMAKKGEFKGSNDCLFFARDVNNLTMRGAATLRMRKPDYMSKDYSKAEWRMGLALWGCSNVTIEGLTIAESGGDGIYITSSDKTPCSHNITIRNVICDGNLRQGISIISADSLLIENCLLTNTKGTSPAAGIDMEPNHSYQRLSNIVVSNCRFIDNDGGGILHYLGHFTTESEEVSILYDNCYITSSTGAGIIMGGGRDGGPQGLIEFRNCQVENIPDAGLWIFDKSADSVSLRMDSCTWKNVATGIDSADGLKRFVPAVFLKDPSKPSPIWFFAGVVADITVNQGGVDFVNCVLSDNADRPVISAASKQTYTAISKITGEITVDSPFTPRMDMGDNTDGITISLLKK